MIDTRSVLRAWRSVLLGRAANLSIEITRECPLRCPGCYAYEDSHVGTGQSLRSVADRKGDDLIRSVLEIVGRKRPLHLSIVGGDPLVRYRELDILLPLLAQRGIHVQVVTSAFRPISTSWAALPNFRLVVSIDGLQPEHDARRKPATYDRILRNIDGHHATVHCTITGQMMRRPGYLEQFMETWVDNPNVERIWFSTFTPQRGATYEECLTQAERERAIYTLLRLRKQYRKLEMPEAALKQFLTPPTSPSECIFAQSTETISADFKTQITPCQFGGNPDCSQCGCFASMALAAVGAHRVVGPVTAGKLFHISNAIGRKISNTDRPKPSSISLPILDSRPSS